MTVLYKTLNQDEILQALVYLAVQTLPRDDIDNISAEFNEEGGVDIMICSKINDISEKNLN